MRTKSIRKSYNTTEEIRGCLAILAASREVTYYSLVVEAIDKLCEVVYLDPEDWGIGARPYGATVDLSPEHLLRVTTRASSENCSMSLVIFSCIKVFVMQHISTWGCETPQEFLAIIRAPNPLELIKLKLDSRQTVTTCDTRPAYLAPVLQKVS